MVEVKITDEESADIEKQKGYREWMDGQSEPRKDALLLTIDAIPGDSEGGFQRRDWRQICVRLRSCAVRALGGKLNDNSTNKRVISGPSGAVIGFRRRCRAEPAWNASRTAQTNE